MLNRSGYIAKNPVEVSREKRPPNVTSSPKDLHELNYRLKWSDIPVGLINFALLPSDETIHPSTDIFPMQKYGIIHDASEHFDASMEYISVHRHIHHTDMCRYVPVSRTSYY